MTITFYTDVFLIKVILGLLLVLTSWLSLSSIIAFMWMYDSSIFTSCRWVNSELNLNPKHCLQINTGLEETRLNLKKVFSKVVHKEFDVFDHNTMSSPAINRARKAQNLTESICTPYDSIPIQDNWSDVSFIVLSAHEIRSTFERDKMFAEVIRKTKKGGHIILVEHIRDLFNTIFFGPGVFHFYSHDQWMNLVSRFDIEHEIDFSVTPFIRVYKFKV